MPKTNHASARRSRKAQRRDLREQRGTLVPAEFATLLHLCFLLIFSLALKLVPKRLDIDCLNLDLEQKFVLLLKWIGHLGVALPGKESADPF